MWIEMLLKKYFKMNIDVLLNYKCMRHSINRIQSKDHWIQTYEINKISLSYFDDKIYIQNNGYDGLELLLLYYY